MAACKNPIQIFDEELPGGGRVAVDVGGGRLVRLRVSHAAAFCALPSYAVIKDRWPDVKVEHSEKDGVYTFQTDALEISLRLDPFWFQVREKQFGRVCFETAENGLGFSGEATVLRRKLSEEEALYGFGEHGESFNRNPGRYRFWNTDDPFHTPTSIYYCQVPFGVALPPAREAMPHGFFLDNPGEVVFDAATARRGVLAMESKTGEFHLWLSFEETVADVLRVYTEMTGRMERPPLWALGFQQCRWSYETETRVREVASGFRDRRIPCDVIYLDIHYMDRYRVFTWNDDRFPEPERMIADLSADGFSTIVIVDPGVAIAEDYAVYREGMEQDGFFLRTLDGELIIEEVWPGKVHHPDFTSPKVRETWGRWQKESLLDIGVAGIWNDMNEPACFGTETITRDYPSDAVHYDSGFYRPHRAIHNIYGMSMARASYEGQKSARRGERVFTLTRSGWAGIQRYSAVWTGDNVSTYASMRLDVMLNLSLGMSGVPFAGCDVGGFSHDATPELFARWMEWGVFQPFCRAHSAAGTLNHEPWEFGAATEKVARRMIELRYQLIPYVYTQFVEASETGLPVNRPLALVYTDPAVNSIGDEFLLGGQLLIAPVLEAGKDHRCLYLPAGDWIHFWSGDTYQGGRWIMIGAPFGRPPLFVKAGSIIPMHPIRQHLKGPEPETTFLDVFPSARMEGKLVEDDGRTMAYEQGEEARYVFSGEEDAKGLNLFIPAPEGSYQSGRKFWTIRIHNLKAAIATVTCNGESVPLEQEKGPAAFSVADGGKALDIRIDWEG